MASGIAVLLACVLYVGRSEPDGDSESPVNTVSDDPLRPSIRDRLSSPARGRDVVVPSAVATPMRAARSNEWSGQIQYVVGRAGPPHELHLRVLVGAESNGPQEIDAFFIGPPSEIDSIARELLDYVTLQESEEAGSEVVADAIRVSGVIADNSQVRFRVTDPSSPLVHVTWIERTNESSSRVTVGGPRRSEASFRTPSDLDALKAILRFPPLAGPDLELRGTYRGHDAESETIVLTLGPTSLRGAELHFPGADFRQFHIGDEVIAIASPTGLVYQRLLDNTLHKRPYLSGKMVWRPDMSDEIAVAPSATKSTGLPSPNVERNVKRLGQQLLIVSEEGVAALLIDNRWHIIPKSTRLPNKIMWAHIDREQACWIAGEGGVTRIKGEEVVFFDASNGLPTKPLAHLMEDSAGRIWVGSWGGGVSSYENSRWRTWTTADGLRHQDVNGCAEDRFGRVWVAGSAGMVRGGHGVSVFAEGKFEQNDIGKELAVNVMSIDGDRDGSIILGFIGGLAIIESDDTIHMIRPEDGLPQRTPQAVYVDRGSRIWAGTWGGGIVQVDSESYRILDEFKLPDAKHVRRITEDDRGNLWVGALEGLWRSSDAGWNKVSTPDVIKKVSVVATIPTPAARMLLMADTQAATAATEKTTDESNQRSSKAPMPGKLDGKLQSRKRSLRVALPGHRERFVIYLEVAREFLLGKLGGPRATQQIAMADGQHTIDVYSRVEPGDLFHVLLIGYNAEDRTEFLDNEYIPLSTPTEDLERQITVMLERYHSSIRE